MVGAIDVESASRHRDRAPRRRDRRKTALVPTCKAEAQEKSGLEEEGLKQKTRTAKQAHAKKMASSPPITQTDRRRQGQRHHQPDLDGVPRSGSCRPARVGGVS